MIEKLQKLTTSQNAVLILFMVLAFSLVFNTFKVIQKNYTLQQKVDKLSDEVALIEVQNQNLKYNIEYYKTDAYLEVEAKRRFNLAENGERVILLPKDGDPESTQQKQTQAERVEAEEKSNFQKWVVFFFGSID